MTHTMKLHPFREVCANADTKIAEGWVVNQQWNCRHCSSKQTMPDANVFYKLGKCEECGRVTDIEADGCNFMATIGPDSILPALKSVFRR